mgnify:CR=1 FL=1
MSMVRNVKGLAFAGLTESGRWIAMDTVEEVGGITGGPKPMEILLQSLMGCTGMDVTSILKKMRQEFDSFEIHEEHERAEEHPKVYTRIELRYIFEGKNLDPEKVKKAVRLSQERYCGVTAMLSKTAEIPYEIVINGERIK